MRLAKTSSISAKFEILTCKNFSFHGNLNDRNNGKIFKILWKKLQELKEITKIWKQQKIYKDLGHCFVNLRWKAKDTVLIFSVSCNANQPVS